MTWYVFYEVIAYGALEFMPFPLLNSLTRTFNLELTSLSKKVLSLKLNITRGLLVSQVMLSPDSLERATKTVSREPLSPSPSTANVGARARARL